MCVICHVPATETLDDARLDRLWSRNPDGGGLAYVSRRNNIVVTKTMDAGEFKEQVKRVQSFRNREDILLHMRIATHGSVSIPNVHPFRVNEPQGREDLVMAHNGIISATAPKKVYDKDKKTTVQVDDRSDTRVFIDEVLNELPLNWLDNPAIVWMVEEFIGSSKLMFLSTRPELRQKVYILNESQGTRRGDLWFSNSNGVDEPTKVTPGTGYMAYWEERDSRYRSGFPNTQNRTTTSREQYSYAINKRRSWDQWFKGATEKEVNNMVFQYQLITEDRHWFRPEVQRAITFNGEVWECMSCYSLIDFDEKTGYADCKCLQRECLLCQNTCYDCECNLTPSFSTGVRRVAEMPRPSASITPLTAKKGGVAKSDTN